MRTDDESRPADRAEARTRPVRRLYDRPWITFREPLEGVASVCGPPNGKSTGLCLIVSS